MQVTKHEKVLNIAGSSVFFVDGVDDHPSKGLGLLRMLSSLLLG